MVELTDLGTSSKNELNANLASYFFHFFFSFWVIFDDFSMFHYIFEALYFEKSIKNGQKLGENGKCAPTPELKKPNLIN